MNLFECAQLQPIRVVPMPGSEEFSASYMAPREAVVFDAVDKELGFTAQWSRDYFRKLLKTIRVHRADQDGVYHFLSYSRIPFEDFEQNLSSNKDMYALEPLLGQGAPTGSDADRTGDFDDGSLPPFISRKSLKTSNLYIGPGGNKTLLHHDEVNSLLIMVEGEKDFIVYPPGETKNLYPYHALNVRSIMQHRVLDSKINPVDIDLARYPRLALARGYSGTLKAGQALFIPAGTWHYIESEGPNVAVNYFWNQTPLASWLQRPLRDFYIKRRIVVAIDFLRKIKHRLEGFFDRRAAGVSD